MASPSAWFSPAILLPFLLGCSGISQNDAQVLKVEMWALDLYKDSLPMLAAEYEALHPGLKVEIVEEPWDGFTTLATTQLIGDMAPDIMQSHIGWANEHGTQNRWFADLMPHLERVNPYTGEKWIDGMYRETVLREIAYDGGIYAVPIDLAGTGVFYNRDIFERLNLQPPNTWREFMELQRKIQEAGITPFLMTIASVNGNWHWLLDTMEDMLLNELFERYDWDGDGRLEPWESARALYKGIFSYREPRYMEMWRLIKDWSQYWPSGFTDNVSNDLWSRGKVAMFWGMTYHLQTLTEDQLRDFEYGIFTFPTITAESTRFYSGRKCPSALSAGGVCFAIPATTFAKGRGERALDFLMYITAPQNAGRMCWKSMTVPNAPGADVHPAVQPFVAASSGFPRFPRNWDGGGAPVGMLELFRCLQLYLLDDITVDEAMTRLDEATRRSIDELIEDKLFEDREEWDPERW